VDKIKWYESTTLRALLVAFVSQVIVWTGVAEQLPDGAATLAVDALLQVIAIAATAYAAWARANRANPPITERAMVRQAEAMVEQSHPTANPNQSGFVRASMLGILLALAVPSVALLAGGCSTFGVQPARSFDQQLAYAYSTHTAVLDSAANALEAGSLTVEDAEAVLAMADQSRVLLDSARLAAGAGDVTTAEGRLALATNVLQQLVAYLNARGVK
jgi:hypothetical protein